MFFIGPVDDRDRCVRLHLVVMQTVEDIECRVYAIDAVIVATRGLRVKMASQTGRREIVVHVRTRREDVADDIDLTVHPCRRTPSSAGWTVPARVCRCRGSGKGGRPTLLHHRFQESHYLHRL